MFLMLALVAGAGRTPFFGNVGEGDGGRRFSLDYQTKEDWRHEEN